MCESERGRRLNEAAESSHWFGSLRFFFSAHLMGPTYEVHVVFVEELCDHVGAEREGDAAVVLAPAQHVFVRVGPQQVAQQALVGHVCGAHDPSHLLHGLEVRGQAWREGGRHRHVREQKTPGA